MQIERTPAADKDIVVPQKLDDFSGVVRSRVRRVVVANEGFNLPAKIEAHDELLSLLHCPEFSGPQTALVCGDLCTHVVEQRTERTVDRKRGLPRPPGPLPSELPHGIGLPLQPAGFGMLALGASTLFPIAPRLALPVELFVTQWCFCDRRSHPIYRAVLLPSSSYHTEGVNVLG